MEPGMNFLSSSSSFYVRTHLKNVLPCSSSSALIYPEQTAPAASSVPIASSSRHFPASVLLQEQREDYRAVIHNLREDRASQVIVDKRQTEAAPSLNEETNTKDVDEFLKEFEKLLLYSASSWSLSSSPQSAESHFTLPNIQAATSHMVDVEPCDVIALAKKALSASKQAALLAEDSKLYQSDLDDSLSTSSSNSLLEEEIKVRSKRRLERRRKNRRAPKMVIVNNEAHNSQKANVRRKLREGFDADDPLRLFLWGPETKRLLTAEEESELILKIQDLIKLEKVKKKFFAQFSRDPTIIELAEIIGVNCQALQSELHQGRNSRERLINANLRMVVHIAKQYQGRGLNLQDLLQEGSMGLMKSVEKFKPQSGCRFATYAYWWIRQTIWKAIYQHSRTIRLPENVYALLGKVTEAKKSLVREGNQHPTKEELARRVGITTDKLETLLYSARVPLSIQQPVWSDQETTFQEVTPDTGIESPEVSVGKKLMRKHVRNLLKVLSPKERRIIRLRYGMEDGKLRSLSEIGEIYGLSKERVRQLENRAFYRLKQNLSSHGLDAYTDLLV